MVKRGPKPKGKVAIRWSPNFAYAIGLLVTDGSVSNDGRHVSFTSKDREQIHNFAKALNIIVPVSHTTSGTTGRSTPRIQFGDRLFCDFLKTIGVSSNKTKTIGAVSLPLKYFADFLRGHLDGDGCIYSYWDKRWRSSFLFYTTFVSASSQHVLWLQKEIHALYGITGHISHGKTATVYQLRYAKSESLTLWGKLYYPGAVCLSRKQLKIQKILRIISEQV